MAKKKKEKFEDDGRTVYDMNVEGFSWHDKNKKNSDENHVKYSFKERLAMFKGALVAYLPMMLCILGGFTITFLLMYFWLK